MTFDISEGELQLSKAGVPYSPSSHHHYHYPYNNPVSSSYIAMEIDPTTRMRKKLTTNQPPSYDQVKNQYQTQLNYRFHPTFSHHQGANLSTNAKKPITKSSYFSIESLMLLFCLTASLLILPLVLPPLPPPPFLLLLLPIGIFGVLMVLAFMPCNVRDLTYKYI